jgi:hypothetical protein
MRYIQISANDALAKRGIADKYCGVYIETAYGLCKVPLLTQKDGAKVHQLSFNDGGDLEAITKGQFDIDGKKCTAVSKWGYYFGCIKF